MKSCWRAKFTVTEMSNGHMMGTRLAMHRDFRGELMCGVENVLRLCRHSTWNENDTWQKLAVQLNDPHSNSAMTFFG